MILVIRRLKQEDSEFKTSLVCVARLCIKTKTQTINKLIDKTKQKQNVESQSKYKHFVMLQIRSFLSMVL